MAPLIGALIGSCIGGVLGVLWAKWVIRCTDVALHEREMLKVATRDDPEALTFRMMLIDVALSRHVWAVAFFRNRARLYQPELAVIARSIGIP